MVHLLGIQSCRQRILQRIQCFSWDLFSFLFMCSIICDLAEVDTLSHPRMSLCLRLCASHPAPIELRSIGYLRSSSTINLLSLPQAYSVFPHILLDHLPPFLNFGNTNGNLNLANRLVAPSALLNPRSSHSFFPIFQTTHPSSLK